MSFVLIQDLIKKRPECITDNQKKELLVFERWQDKQNEQQTNRVVILSDSEEMSEDDFPTVAIDMFSEELQSNTSIYLVAIMPTLLVEYASYSQEIVHPQKCAFEWWEEHKFMYPLLHLVASMMLIIKPSSVQCERIFSKCARFLTKYRAALEVGTLDSCVFLDRSLFYLKKHLMLYPKSGKETLKTHARNSQPEFQKIQSKS